MEVRIVFSRRINSPFITYLTIALVSFGLSHSAFAQDFIQVPEDVAGLQTAINQVSDGGIIEISTNLTAPTGGFVLSNLNKGFTIRAATGVTVVLSGNGVTNILRSDNTSHDSTGPLVFQNLSFENGYSNTAGVSAGVMLDRAQATFVGCEFRDNVSENGVVGGATYVGDESTALFLDCLWTGNTSQTGGAGLGIRGASRVFVHNSRFLFNLANPPDHNANSGGGGINSGNSTLRVSNTRFEGNETGGFGGGLYSIGNWLEPFTTPRSDIIVSNCTFIDNKAERHPSVNGSSPTEGGAINAEDQTLMKIYNSRFITNSAMIGGGVNLYRSTVEIYGSTFKGNQATDTAVGSGFGGAISLTSQDGAAAGEINYPVAKVVLEDSFVQGRYGAVTTVAQAGGGLRASGDSARIDGDPNPPDKGTLAENRAVVTIRNTVFYDCDVYKPIEGAGNGGAISVGVTQLDMQDSLVIDCDAMGGGPGASGGGITVMNQSVANITDTLIAGNTALKFGAGLFAQGSEINVSGCTIVENEISPGVAESVNESFGAGIFTGPDVGRDLAVTGVVENSIISNNIGMQVFDDDRNAGPINDVRYNSNIFYSTHFGTDIFNNSITPKQNAAGLNALEVVRSGAPNTFKSQVDNSQPGTAPVVGALLAVPPQTLGANAPGDPAPPTDTWLGYAWSGDTATLDGNPVTGNTGVSASTVGIHELLVGSNLLTAAISDAALPQAMLTPDPEYIQSGETSDLSWATPGGTFLDCEINQGISITPAASGTVPVSAILDRTFYLATVTEEGGTTAVTTVFVGDPPELIFTDGFESSDSSLWSSTVQ